MGLLGRGSCASPPSLAARCPSNPYQPESGLKSIEELVKEAEEEQAEQAEKEEIKEKGKEQKGKKGRKDSNGEEEKKKLDPTKLARVPPPTEPTIALVRHFHMDAPYRPPLIQNDLLSHGVSKAFAVPSVHTAYFLVSKLTPWLEEVSKTMGMRKCPGPLGEELAPEVKGSRRGVQGWREWWVGVGRAEWEKSISPFGCCSSHSPYFFSSASENRSSTGSNAAVTPSNPSRGLYRPIFMLYFKEARHGTFMHQKSLQRNASIVPCA
ncbi:hypothetical protein CALVIDRAFT_526626 [Calocera viscosa TUFC12733]|uniref:Uncharacterized protein n=1 Tax=Calocera viscosa (strain TUFC12733) TaxID=1330018 RepID=A0A167N887_CALVF|nr:hypothetical protein CALVIDRAFT_526626 [Calocera viscosa TUFC12733]